MQFLKSIIIYSIRSRLYFLLLFLAVAVIFFTDIFTSAKLDDLPTIQSIRDQLWTPLLEHYVAFGTFLVAFAAWFSNVKREWKEGLPKRLSVKFWYEGKVVMQCDYAYLSGESDIRQVGQQIGAQMSGTLLKFNVANIVWSEEPIVYNLNDYDPKIESFFTFPFRHYKVKYELSSLPESFSGDYQYIWKPPFDLNVEPEDLKIKNPYKKNEYISYQYNERIKIK